MNKYIGEKRPKLPCRSILNNEIRYPTFKEMELNFPTCKCGLDIVNSF